jgi:hypothetical protein
MPEVVLAGAVLGIQHFAHHVRQLEDTGLAIFQGREPGGFWIIIVVGLFFIGATALACEAGAEEICTILGVLVFIGMLLLGSVCIETVANEENEEPGSIKKRCGSFGILIGFGLLLDFNAEQDAMF